ncbi:lipoprotein-releasing system transmembrane subunit LolC [Kangiella profundi]|uniref:Lipoprotein-releasing system transmembrane subunit LolC n=1 Tax=Kangiella profundi TaxID=1561924 RepID=A0A2K9AUT0_9GAMM|nr:lipoprotein-releasing ABC transporter permease subunit [Kangiella profundi]AUD78901.1 lipoprotein-releasing system transmembrane subunit LolC [Kangiella profundi]GGF03134.1 cell division protein FtsX [Kangiella profundi]
MRLPFSLFVGLRYTRAKRRNHFISFISLISMIGIALGVMVLITVMSVMNGFERELRDRILGMAPHVLVQGLGGPLEDWQSLEKTVKQHPEVIGVSPYIQTETMFRFQGRERFGMVQGILPDKIGEVSIVKDNMSMGSFDDIKSGEYNIVLGASIARGLGINLGDKVSLLILSETRISLAGVSMRTKRFTVTGIFETRSEADKSLAFIHMDDAAQLLRQEGVTALQLKTDNVMNVYDINYQVSQLLDHQYFVTDWTRQHETLFNAIDMEKKIMFILLTFIIAVAAFNIVTSLVMLVTEKQADIAILRTLGASPGSILRIFMTSGIINGLIGTLAGVILGVLLALNLPDIVSWVETTFGVSVFPQDVYFVNFLPTELIADDVIKIGLSAFAISVLATLYPSWKASKTQPAEALRYE